MSPLSLFKSIGGPGSIGFLIAALAAWVFLRFVWPRRVRLARVWLLALLGSYLILALPLVSHAIANGLPAARSAPPDTWAPLQTLIVLDGDNRRGRVSRATEVYARTTPKTVWVLGDAWMMDPLLQAGIPWGKIQFAGDSANTLDQIDSIERMVALGGLGRTAVIASRVQLPRVEALARARKLPVLLIGSPIDIEPPTSGFRALVPTYAALRTSRDAFYEHVALAYYRWQGWIGS